MNRGSEDDVGEGVKASAAYAFLWKQPRSAAFMPSWISQTEVVTCARL